MTVATSSPGARAPDAVERPVSTEEVADLMAWATAEGVGVLPVGSGRRARPVVGEGRYILLRTDGLAGIDHYEAADLTLAAGAGTPVRTVTDALAANDQWAPFDPPFVDQRTLGGFVALGESGPLQTGYGALRNHVLGMTVVTGDGRVVRLGGRVVKNVAGYDLLKAVIGSRGSLAVITSVVLRAFPVPPVDRVLVLEGRSMAHLLDMAQRVGTAPVLPVSTVIVDSLAEAGGRPALVLRLHGAAETVDADRATLETHTDATFQRHDHLDLAAVRDHAGEGEAIIVATARPSRLTTVVEAMGALEPTGLFIDPYTGRVRAAAALPDLEVVGEVRTRIESADGALRLDAPKLDGEAWRQGTRPSAGEATIIDGLRTAFDPGGVLWPARR